MSMVIPLLLMVIGDAAPAGAAGAAARPMMAKLPIIGAERAAAMRVFLVMREY
jgi:hypothetical protein